MLQKNVIVDSLLTIHIHVWDIWERNLILSIRTGAIVIKYHTKSTPYETFSIDTQNDTLSLVTHNNTSLFDTQYDKSSLDTRNDTFSFETQFIAR